MVEQSFGLGARFSGGALMAKAPATTELEFVPVDITQATMRGAYGTSERNIWRVDDTIIVYERGEWLRYPLQSDEAKAWIKFMRNPRFYREWSGRLREYLTLRRRSS